MKTKHIVLAVIAVIMFTLLGVTKVEAENGPSNLYAFVQLDNMEEFHSIYSEQQIYNDEIEGVTYDLETNTVTLNNVNKPKLVLSANKMGDDFKIKLVGENNLAIICIYGDNYGGSLTITGDGVLNIDTSNFGLIPNGEEEVNGIVLYAENDNAKLTIEDTATVNIKAQSNAIKIIDTPNSNKSNAIILKNGQDISSNLTQEEHTITKHEEVQALVFTDDNYPQTYKIYEKDGKMYGMKKTSSQYIITKNQIVYDSKLNKYFLDPTSSDSGVNNIYNTEEEILKDGYVATTNEAIIDCYVNTSIYGLSKDSKGNKYVTYKYYYDGEMIDYVFDVSDYKITLSDGKEYSVLTRNNEVDSESLEYITYKEKTSNYDYIVPLKALNITAGEQAQANNGEEQQEDTKLEESTNAKIENAENNDEDVAAKKEVEKLVESIISLKTGTVDGIDENLANKIRQKVENGETILVNVVTEEVKAEDVAQDVKKVEDKISGSNKKIAALFDIDILVKTAQEELGNVTNLKDKITLTVPIPKDLPDIPEGYTRNYKVIRVHDGVAEELDTTVSGENLSFTSDKFSTYAITYEDIKNTETLANVSKGINTPATGDNIVLYIAIFTIATIGLVVTIKKLKNK